MKNFDTKRAIYIILAIMIFALGSFAVGLILSFLPRTARIAEEIPNTTDFPEFSDFSESSDVVNPFEIFDLGIFQDPIPRISSETRMVYEYNSISNGIEQRILEQPSSFLIGMTQEEIADMFMDWEITEFSSDEVVLRRDILSEQERVFIIGAHEGFIAVFYNPDKSGIVELTNKPISALPIEEQERLKEGIEVFGDEELFRALEDFSS